MSDMWQKNISREMEGDAGVSRSEVGAQGGEEPRARRGRRLLRITQNLSLITVILVQ